MQGHPSPGCTPTLCSTLQGGTYSEAERGAAGARRMHLPTALSPVAISTREEKAEGSHAPDAEIKPTSPRNEQQSPEVQTSLTHC